MGQDLLPVIKYRMLTLTQEIFSPYEIHWQWMSTEHSKISVAELLQHEVCETSEISAISS